MARLTALLMVAAAAVAAGWSPPPGWQHYAERGVTLRFPPTWYATTTPLTHVTDPVQIVAVASYPLPHDNSGDDGCEPKEALDGLPSSGALLYGWEYPSSSGFGAPNPRDFPKLPAHFRLSGFAHYECLGPSYLLRFRTHGRFFQLHVALGPRATSATRATVVRILDTFRAQPS